MIEELIWLILTLGIIGLVIWGVWTAVAKRTKLRGFSDFMLDSKTLSELYYALGFGFGELGVLALNRDLGTLLPLQYISLASGMVILALGIRLRLMLSTLMGIVMLSSWWIYKVQDLTNGSKEEDIVMAITIGGLFVFFAIIGRILRKSMSFKPVGTVLTVIGTLATVLYLFLISTEDTLTSILKDLSRVTMYDLAPTLLVLVPVVAIVLVVMWAIQKKCITQYETISAITLVGIFIVLYTFGRLFTEQGTTSDWGYRYTSTVLTQLGFIMAFILNAFSLLYILFLLFTGYSRRETVTVNAAVLFLVIFLIVKYFDWFYDFFDKSIFFIGAGVLLFAVGFGMERGRRAVLKSMRSES